MAWQKIQVRCNRCNGTGVIVNPHNEEIPESPVEVTCPHCGGDKYLNWGRLKVEVE